MARLMSPLLLHHRRLSSAAIVLGCLVIIFIALMSYIGFLSLRYDESPYSVATKVARHFVLTVIEIGIRTFEPEDRYQFAASPNTPREVFRTSTSISPTEAQFADLDFRDISHQVDSYIGQSLFHFGRYPEANRSALRNYLKLDQFIQVTQMRFAQEQRGNWEREAQSESIPDVYILAELTNLVSELWDHREPGTYVSVDFQNFSTLRLAERAKDGEAFYCQVFAMALIEVSRALGYHGRLLSLSHEGIGYQHGVAEIWLPDLGKWAVFDADFNLFYGSPREPLSATEISGMLSQKRRLPVVHGRTVPNRTYTNNRVVSVERAYNNIEWAFRNDFWSNQYFRGHPNKSDSNSLIWSGNSTRSNRLTFKRTTSNHQIANFSVLSYAFRPVTHDANSATLAGELALHYPGARRVEIQHQSGAPKLILHESGKQLVILPVNRGENTYTITIYTDGYSIVRRSFHISSTH